MTNINSLEQVERKVFASYFNDGMWDIYGGLILLGFGLAVLTGQMILLIVCIALAMVPVLVRKPVVTARLGNVQFSSHRQVKTARYKVLAWVAGLLFLVLGIVLMAWYSAGGTPTWFDNWMKDYFFIAIGAMLATLVWLAAYATSVARFYLHGLVVMATFIAASLLKPENLEGIPLVSGGGLVLLIGIFLLVRFLKNNPVHGGKED